jgi:hypothetical protein
MKTTTILSAPDDYGTRWSYDRTISVHRDPGRYTVYDTLRRVTHSRQSLDQARQIARQILDARPQLDWLRSWKHCKSAGTRVPHEIWERVSFDHNAAIWLTRGPEDPDLWRVEIDVNRHQSGRMRSYGWMVEIHHGIGPIKAQALAWAAHRAQTEESP